MWHGGHALSGNRPWISIPIAKMGVMTALAPTITLNDGLELPLVGLGTWPMNDDEAVTAVRGAIEMGYRLIDTAAKYENEEAVGRGVAAAAVPREEVVVTTKLRGSEQGYDEAKRALRGSLARLGMDYVDLYLIHWPLTRLGRFVDSWRAMIELKEEGLVRSIGVSNFTVENLDEIITATGVTPSVNQVQLHVWHSQRELQAGCEVLGVKVQAWSPLGRRRVDDPMLDEFAACHGVTAAQVALRWQTQRGVSTVPKSADPGRQAQNLDIFGFELTPDEIATLNGLDRAGQAGDFDPVTHEEF